MPAKPSKESPSKVDALERNPSGRRTIIRNDVTGGSIHTAQGGSAVVRPGRIAAKPTIKRSSKGRIKSSTVAVYAGVFTLFVAIIAIGYRGPQEDISASASSPIVDSSSANAAKPAVNDVVATDIAASVAHTAALAVAPNVSERAVSTRVQAIYASTDSTSVAKPSVVAVAGSNKDIKKYKVLEGDTVDSVATKFGISADTIKWANNLRNNNLVVDTELEILPRDGVLYTVKDGDTLEKIAEKYKADASLITTYNDLELNGLTSGQRIMLPSGSLPETERPGYVAPVVNSGYTAFSGRFITGVGTWSGQVLGMQRFKGVDANSGGYAWGNCTAWAFYRRAELGMPIPRMLGNASSWAVTAAGRHVVNKTPAFGAVIQAGNHVGIVEQVLPNGDLRISDMNYGYSIYNLADRIIPASTVHNYMYIH